MSMNSPIPENEAQRLEALKSYHILDTLPEQEYDDLTYLAATICNSQISTIAFIDETRKWHKAKFGINKESVPREYAICSHTITGKSPLIVNDTLAHELFSKIGMVVNPPHVRFYAGIPLLSSTGHAIGTICVVDTKPKTLTKAQIKSLEMLARAAESLLELRRTVNLLQQQKEQLQQRQNKIDILNHELSRLSRTDDLTGLWNRRVQNEVLNNEFSRRDRNNAPIGLCMLDIDKFKGINDRFGHKVGDTVIQLVANVLQGQTRDIDYCIRYGGDEFIIVLPNTDADSVGIIAERILTSIAEESKQIHPFTVSIGAIAIQGQCITIDDALQAVDQSLYQAKSAGRNRVELKVI